MEEKQNSAATVQAEKRHSFKQSVNTKTLVIAGLLSAIGIIIPLVIPKIYLGPGMSVTLGSHVAVMMAMFINPWIAGIVGVTTSLGFLSTGNPVIVLRAFSHLVFAISGAFVAKKFLPKVYLSVLLNVVIAIIHAVCEALVVYVSMKFIFPEMMANLTFSFAYYVTVVVGAITLAHSAIDFTIAYAIYRPLNKFHLLGQ